ncbi:hypothetical protein [Candidatus Odyssella acanthamoebae]|uniref:Uncharacterized protein n=1 Tax=Candidatus Odyssella acanthamoebae TaxID=91604 RepID=A0A077B067_9PROT|nr:hypothetical protein [Candidatus Paracaedibacter acanthamoebae]AIK96345.1 hypothetical protein ID47_05755 [Candidatus Paracaedibacter acanthamoebae]
MIRIKNIIKFFTILMCLSTTILSVERRSEADPTSPDQVLTIELKTLTPGFGLETFFRDKKEPNSTHERDLAEQAYWIAERMLCNKEGERALEYIGFSLYLGYPKIIDTIYTVGFKKNRYGNLSSILMQEVKDKFLEGCRRHGISSSPSKNLLQSKYQEAWDENQKTIEAIEAEQKKLRRWGPFSSLVLKAQEFLVAPEPLSPVGGKQTVPSSEKDAQKDIRKRTRSQEAPPPHLKSRQRKVADAEKQPLLQGGEPEESITLEPDLQHSSNSVRQRKPASPTKQPLPAGGKTVDSASIEAKKRN